MYLTMRTHQLYANGLTRKMQMPLAVDSHSATETPDDRLIIYKPLRFSTTRLINDGQMRLETKGHRALVRDRRISGVRSVAPYLLCMGVL